VLRLDMHFIMLMAICAAVAIKDWTESATIAFVFSLAELLQQAAQHHVRTQIGKLAVSAPKTAALESGELIAIKDIVIGTQLVARSGERVAVDGLVTSGLAGVDESAVTGESAPQTRAPGLRVSAGTVVVSGYVSYTATSTASNSTLAHVKAATEEAQARPSRTQTLVSRFATYYTPAVVVLAVVVVVVGVAAGGDNREWTQLGLAILVVACPCSLVLSAPVATVASLAKAAQLGVLVKGGDTLESCASLHAVAWDKTGTLTEGRFRVTDVVLARTLRDPQTPPPRSISEAAGVVGR